MSEYTYDDRDRRRSTRTRVRDREPEYVEETTYIQRGTAPPSRELVFRGREDSIEEISRAFPPPRGSRRRARSVGRRDDYSEDDYYYDGGYDRTSRRGRLSRQDSYYSDDDYDRRSRYRDRSRHKSKVEEVLEDFGLGGVAAGATNLYKKARSKSRGPRDRHDRHDRRDRYDRYDRSRSSSSSGGDRSKSKKWQHAARAAVLAGAAEAVRSRKTPGAWTGEKGTRVATAAFSAAGIDGLVDRGRDEHSKRHTAEAVIGGLVSNRLVHGSRSRSRGRQARSGSRSSDDYMPARSRSRSIIDRFRAKSRGRDRDRSESRGRGLKELAAGGAIAAAGKTIYDRIRSKSRRRRSPSSSSNDSYVPSRSQRYRSSRGQESDRGMDDRGMDDRGMSDRGMDDGPDYEQQAPPQAGGGAMMRGGGGAHSISSESTTDLDHRTKRMRGKELITAGLATAATIHAVHGVWNSINASEKRHKLVAEGEMSPEEARKRRSKALLQDAAAVGVAALGIKGAFSEWKEMKEHRDEVRQLEVKRRKRRKMRERASKDLRQGFGGMPPGYGYPMMHPGAIMPAQYQQQGGPSNYADGNPYGGQSVPPPPMGEASERY